MNAAREPFIDVQDTSTNAPRLREIPYNYTSFSDREIVIRLLGAEPVDAARRAARRARAPAARRACCTRCSATSGWSSAIPYLQDDLLDNPRRQQLLVEALHHRLNEIEKRRRGERRARRRPCAEGRARSWSARARRSTDSPRPSPRPPTLRKRVQRTLKRYTRSDNICFDGLARVSHVTDATDWRVEYPFVVLTPDTEDEVRGLVRRLHRARPHHHSARRRHRLHRRRHSARRALRGHQHREARAPHGGRAHRAAGSRGAHARRSTAAPAWSRSA